MSKCDSLHRFLGNAFTTKHSHIITKLPTAIIYSLEQERNMTGSFCIKLFSLEIVIREEKALKMFHFIRIVMIFN